MNCENYIKILNKTTGWEPKDQGSPTNDEPTTAAASVDVPVNENVPTLLIKPEQLKDPLLSNYNPTQTVPIPSDSIEKMYKEPGTKEGSQAHKALEHSMEFSYSTLLGELMYTYITCHPDIGYEITTLSKFSCAPGSYHYKLLKMVARYLQATSHWGIRYKCSKLLLLSEDDYKWGFFPTTPYSITNDPTLKELFDVNINTNKLVGFVDAAHANKLHKRSSTTGVVFTFMEGAVVYKSKTQSITSSSSTEAEFITAHAVAKIA